MQRYFATVVILVLSAAAFGQLHPRYTAFEGNDTLSISLTSQELTEYKFRRVAVLKHDKKKRKKKLLEESGCTIKLHNKDSTFYALFVDFYSDYFIALTGIERRISKSKYSITLVGYRRIRFEEIEWMETDGKRNIIPQVLLSGAIITVGASLITLSIKDSKSQPDDFPLGFLPVALGVTYVGVRLFDDILTKRYYMDHYTLTVKTLNPKRLQKD